MKRIIKEMIFFTILIGLSMSTSLALADGDDEIPIKGSIALTGQNKTNDKAKMAALAKVSKHQAEQIAIKSVPGKILSAKLENEDGFLVYEVKVRDSKHRTFEVLVDAGTGSILRNGEDADDGAKDK